MAKTRSNKRTTNTVAVDKKALLENSPTTTTATISLPSTTTTTTTTQTSSQITPTITNAFGSAVNTRTRSKKSRDGLLDDKSNKVINSKQNSKINLAAIENRHNTRRRNLNSKDIKNPDGADMESESSPETGTDANDSSQSPVGSSVSDNENEVIKVIEIVDESQSYNLHDDDDDDGKEEYELMYVEDVEEGDGEIEYLNEEYLLEDDFIIQDTESQNSMIIEEIVEDFTVDDPEIIHDEVNTTEAITNVDDTREEIVLTNSTKLPQIVPMATRSRRGHVNISDILEKSRSTTRRKTREKSADMDRTQDDSSQNSLTYEHAAVATEVKQETNIKEEPTTKMVLEAIKSEETPVVAPKIFIPNIEPPATRARCRKSTSTSTPMIVLEHVPIKEEQTQRVENVLPCQNRVNKPEVDQKKNAISSSMKEEKNLAESSPRSIIQNMHEPLVVENPSVSKSITEQIESMSKQRGRRRTKLLSTPSPPENPKFGIENDSVTKTTVNKDELFMAVSDSSKVGPVEETCENILQTTKSNEGKIDKWKSVENRIIESPLLHTSPTKNPAPIRTTRLSKAKNLKIDLETSVEKIDMPSNTKSEENKVKIELLNDVRKREENEPPPKVKESTVAECEIKVESENKADFHADSHTNQTDQLNNCLNEVKMEVVSDVDEKNKTVSDPKSRSKLDSMEVDTELEDTWKKENPDMKKQCRRSRKESPPPSLKNIEVNEADSKINSAIENPINKSVNHPSIIEENEVEKLSSVTNTTITSNVSNALNKPDEKLEENKKSQEQRPSPRAAASRAFLAYTSIISTRRQKKELIKSEAQPKQEAQPPIISENCMAIVEKLLQDALINKTNEKNVLSAPTESQPTELPKIEEQIEQVKLQFNDITVSEMDTSSVPANMTMEMEKSTARHDKMDVDEIKSPVKKFDLFKVPELEEKLKDIKLAEIKMPLIPRPPVPVPNSTKIKEFETKINRNFYAEAFAGLSNETKTHIFEALMRSKADTATPNAVIPVNIEVVSKEESVEFDEKKNIFVKKKSNKKIKKSSKKERKLDKSDDKLNDDDESLRRSSRIKTISQTRQRSHGHGLVKDRDRFRDINEALETENSGRVRYKALEIDAVESKDYAAQTEETEAEKRREREMIHRLKQFTTVKENIYHCDKNISKEAKKMTCDCFLTKEEIERGELGCGEDCLNRLLMIECGPKCVVGERCTNRKFQKTQYANCKVFQTEKKGFGIMAGSVIPPGEFIMEYVGEVLNSEQFEKRADDYSKEKNKHYYFMALRSDAVIDATTKGNVSRFINHSCDPNAETQKWTVNGELRIGFFSTRAILKGEEITFDYQFQRYGKEAQKCYCEASNCRGWIGEEPDSADEDEDDEEEDEDEETAQQPSLSEKIEGIIPVVPVLTTIEIKEIVDEKVTVSPAVSKVSIPTEVIDKPMPDVPPLVEIQQPTVAEKLKKPTKKERKALVKTRKTRSELLEDADLEEEINILNRTGLKNQAHTLKLSRLMVRAKLMNARVRLVQLLQNGEMPCRRLFLDYHGLRLLHGWMSDSTSPMENLENLKFQRKLLETLKSLPIPNKTMLKDSKVIYLVQKWSLDDKKNFNYSPSDDTPSDSGSGTPIQQTDSPNHVLSQSSTISTQAATTSRVDDELSYVRKNIIKISLKLIESWESLPEVFRIPKKERIEQMKEHEREADLRYKALGLSEDHKKEKFDRYQEKKREREKQRNHDKKLPYNNNNGNGSSSNGNNNSGNKSSNNNTPQLDKFQRRQMFEMKFAKEQEEKKKQEYFRLHEMTCNCFRLDPRKTVPEDVPAIVNPATGQWYTKEMKPVPTPPSHAHITPPEQVLSTDPDDYNLPTIDLPPHWKFAIDTKGRIYYYHVKIRIPQWEPPIFLPPLAVAEEIKPPKVESKEKDADADKESSSTDTNDSSEDELKERINNLKQRFKERGQPLPEINITDSELVESLNTDAKNRDKISDTFPRIDPVKSSYKINKRKRRRQGLVQERIISPRTEEDKMYGQQQSRMYRETKEKLRRRKEEMRKRRQLELGGSSSTRNNKIIKLTDGLPVSITPYDSDESDDDQSEQSHRRNNDSVSNADPDSAVDFVESLISYNMSDNDARLLDGLKEIGKEKTNKKNVYEEWKKQQAKLKSDARKREFNQTVSSGSIVATTSSGGSSSNSGASSSSHIKRRKVVMDNVDLSNDEIRRIKEKFRTDIAGVIVQHLGPYRKETCKIGRIVHDEDFKHLARKLTHFVMLKELKHCDNTVNILEVTDSVKIKSREFIKKYMIKYGAIYRRGENEPDYKD